MRGDYLISLIYGLDSLINYFDFLWGVYLCTSWNIIHMYMLQYITFFNYRGSFWFRTATKYRHLVCHEWPQHERVCPSLFFLLNFKHTTTINEFKSGKLICPFLVLVLVKIFYSFEPLKKIKIKIFLVIVILF